MVMHFSKKYAGVLVQIIIIIKMEYVYHVHMKNAINVLGISDKIIKVKKLA